MSVSSKSDDVGEVTATMGFRHFDDRTRPFEREDLSDYIVNNYYTMPIEEKSIVDRAIYSMAIGVTAAFSTGYYLSGKMPWKQMGKNIGFPKVYRFGRPCFGLALCVFPLVYVQQRFLSEVGELPMSFPLSFHIRRMLITQRGAVMFGRSTLREVTKEEQTALERAAVQIKRENTNTLTGNSIDVNAELQKQVMLPIAQSGYKSMPKQ
eukprot:GILI01033157.1.p1 GENE.GILI01033157.1~~GILI01033157.1.p1  ORF type:complete len:208 (+),score=34.79 GILI01033157.1:54-677(+)